MYGNKKELDTKWLTVLYQHWSSRLTELSYILKVPRLRYWQAWCFFMEINKYQGCQINLGTLKIQVRSVNLELTCPVLSPTSWDVILCTSYQKGDSSCLETPQLVLHSSPFPPQWIWWAFASWKWRWWSYHLLRHREAIWSGGPV